MNKLYKISTYEKRGKSTKISYGFNGDVLIDAPTIEALAIMLAKAGEREYTNCSKVELKVLVKENSLKEKRFNVILKEPLNGEELKGLAKRISSVALI